MQNTISECTTRRTLKQLGYSSIRPHRVPLLSAKNMKRRLQFALAHQNWTKLCLVWWDLISAASFSHSWWWCNGVGDIFLAHFGPLSTNWASFKCQSLPKYCSWPCHPFITTVYPSSDGYFQQDNAPCHKAQIISDWLFEHDNYFTLLKWLSQSPDLNPIEHL